MPARPILLLLVLAMLAASACAGRASPGGARPGEDALVAEARRFMDEYALDLRSAARQALADRYDPRGAYMVGEGDKRFLPLDSLRAHYLGEWRPPAQFAWEDLSFEVAGPDAVVVIGGFLWRATASSADVRFSYTALLVRRDGRFRIRLEDESRDPRRRPTTAQGPAPTDAFGVPLVTRIDASSGRVARIVVRPEALELRVGDSLLVGMVRAVGIDSAGREVGSFVPTFRIGDGNAALIRAGWLVATQPGRTALLVRPMRVEPRPDPAGEATTTIPVLVRP